MTLQQLRYAVAVSDCHSINKAAKEFYLSQPALSGSIKELEDELGIILFERTNRGANVTPEGKHFLGYARQLLEQYELIEYRFIKKQIKEKFGVSCQHYTFAVKAFVELVSKVGMDKFEFSITETRTADVIEDVRSFKSEIGVIYMDDFNRSALNKLLKENDLVAEPLFKCKTYVYLSAKHPLAKKKSIKFEELKPYPNLTFDQGSNNSFYLSEEVLSTREYDKLIKCNDRGTILNLMIGLNGYTLCSGIICEDLNGTGYKAIPLEDKEVMDIVYIHRVNSTLSALGKEYVEYLEAYEKYVL